VQRQTPAQALPPGSLGAWWLQGARAAVFMRADADRPPLTPALIGCLLLASVAATIGVQRTFIDGPVDFHWQALISLGLINLAVWLICAWLLVEPGREAAAAGRETLRRFSLLCAQALALLLPAGALVLLVRQVDFEAFAYGPLAVWGGAIALLLWCVLAQAVMLWRGSSAGKWRRGASVSLVAATLLCTQWFSPVAYWYPGRDDSVAAEPTRFRLTQERFESQARSLARQLGALPAQRPKDIDVYALTFAPYASESVFRKESALVSDVMQSRFGAHAVQLVSLREEDSNLPWATTLNLRHAIAHVAGKMDREQDILFIHLTSHGGRDGKLATAFWPLDVDPLTAPELKAILDEAGIRNRVISVSACYSGTWIDPLADANTLVMTAADNDHTSYGCGHKSELTFFGRAIYDEALRETLSFEEAHARARVVIEKREQQAGKDDGFSNPQISVGEQIRERLATLQVQLSAKNVRN
jgi:hypothetical protein